MTRLDDKLLAELEANGYHTVAVIGDKIVGLHDYITTRGIVVGLDAIGYERRYCYQNRQEAAERFIEYAAGGSTHGHPGGNWIKLKGTYQGRPVDLLNPEWSRSE